MSEASRLFEAILNGDASTAAATAREAIADGVPPLELVTRHMVPAMDEVGRRFESEEYFVPELLLSARAMKAALSLLQPLLTASGAQPAGRVVIGTVKGDLHDIGKNLVASMFEGGGFDVVDLGANVPPERFVEAADVKKADIVALSALLTVTMPAMRRTIEAFTQAGLRERVKIIIGGAPVTDQYARSIGADGYSANASAAVALANRMLKESRG
jgi:corrinoid protein of di/trimethylamine methyltransferase